jgi:TP901 family phage tail tape measure protein
MAFKGIQVIINGIDKLSPVLDSPMKKLEKMGQSFSKVGRAATIGLSLPILAAGAASVKSAIDINSSMANIATLIPGNTERVLSLKKSIQDLSIASGKSTKDIGSGLYQVISTFGDTADTVKLLDINVRAASAGLATTEQAILFTGAVTKAYGDTSAAAMQKVADLGFQTVNLGVTTFPELAEAIGNVTPLAKTMGISLEELFGVMATATGVTGNTSAVATQFASVLTSLIKPTENMASMLNYLGFASGEAMLKEYGFTKTLKTIVEMSNKAGISLGTMFGRKEAMVLSLALTGTQSKELEKKIDAMRHSSGALTSAFKEQTQGINKAGFQFSVLGSKLTVLAQKAGDKLLPVITELVDKFTPLIDKFINMQPEALKLILVIGGLLAVIGPLILGFSMTALTAVNLYKALVQIPIAVKAVTFVFKTLGTVMKGLFLNPVGLSIIAIGLLIYNIYLLKKNWGSITDAFSSKFMIIQTLSFFLADIAKSIGHIIAFIPGLGKVAGFFKLAGKGFEIQASERSNKQFGVNPVLARDRIGTEGVRPNTFTQRASEIERLSREKKEKSEVLVKFENAPKGMRIQDVKSGSVDINTELGSILSGAY